MVEEFESLFRWAGGGPRMPAVGEWEGAGFESGREVSTRWNVVDRDEGWRLGLNKWDDEGR